MLPQDFLDRMQGMLGEESIRFVKSLEEERFQALRLNPLKRDKDNKTAGMLLQQTFHLTPVSWEPNGYYYEAADQPGRHPYHEAGLYYIQEPSAMAPVPLLQVQPGERVLDLCAAPGGKSTQLAAALRGKGLLVSNEIHPARARILSENIERMGISNACVINETPQRLAQLFPAYFDKLLVDAPCSGEGMFRKNEDAGEQWSMENVELCAQRQDEILNQAALMLREGGRMVYSTCTFAPAENEGTVSRFLQSHPDFALLSIEKECFEDKAGAHTADGRPEWIAEDMPGLKETLRLWPHYVQGEGHFAAVLVKKTQDTLEEATKEEHHRRLAATGLEKGFPVKELGEAAAFIRDSLQPGWSNGGSYLRFGEQLYLMPEEMPGLRGLKVLRPGLHLGTLKKNRFEPSHALALALSQTQVKQVWELDCAAAQAYLRGETFLAEGEKGWYLLCVNGYSIGWGKLAGGIMKNHYPKGLRKSRP